MRNMAVVWEGYGVILRGVVFAGVVDERSSVAWSPYYSIRAVKNA